MSSLRCFLVRMNLGICDNMIVTPFGLLFLLGPALNIASQLYCLGKSLLHVYA